MVSPTLHSDTFYGALAEMAEKLRHEIVGLPNGERLPFVQRRVTDSEIVFGVWPDPDAAGGFGFHLIKGRGHLAGLKAKLPDELKTTAIPCVGIDQAMAAEQLWGEPPAENPSEVPPQVRRKKKAKPKESRALKGSSPAKRARGTPRS